jgi:hypothetical protein
MSEKPSSAQVQNAVDRFVRCVQWMNMGLLNTQDWITYIAQNCVEVFALSQKPGTVMRLGTQPAFDWLRGRSSWEDVKRKIKDDPALFKTRPSRQNKSTLSYELH